MKKDKFVYFKEIFHVKEANWVVHTIVGISAYLNGIGYDLDKWRTEIDAMVEHANSST